MNISKLLLGVLIIGMVTGCMKSDPNTNESGKDELTSLEVSDPILKSETAYSDIIYVPIYSAQKIVKKLCADTT